MATKPVPVVPTPTPERRIYGVVAETVQTNLEGVYAVNPRIYRRGLKYIRTEATISVVQPAGRLAVQHGHAVSMVREARLKEALNTADEKQTETILHSRFIPFTTIMLAARDSFELYHLFDLLQHYGVMVQAFYDTDQPDYGDPSVKVMTAIATEPVYPDEVVGILDYLPLWSPRPEPSL